MTIRIHKTTGWAIFVLLLVLLTACEQAPLLFAGKHPKAPVNPHLEAFIDEYVDFFESELHRTQLPGAALAIVLDSNVVFLQGFGVKSIHSKDSVDVHTVFRIGSLSKGFAGVLTGLLIQDSMLSLTDPVEQYLPYFQLRSPDQTRRVQVRHLLSHSTGLPYHTYTNLVEAGQDLPTIAGRFKEVKLVGKEGEVFSYQNAAFSLIEEIVREKTGKSYARTLDDLLFKPAGMNDASASYEQMAKESNKAFPHDGQDSAWMRTEVSTKFYNAVAAGGVNASISDMSQWLLLLLGNRPDLIHPSTLDTVFAPRIKTNNERRFFSDWLGDKEAFYGLGWRILQTPTDTIIYHGGYVNSYKGEVAINRKEKVGVCILMNGAGSLSGTLIPGFFERYETYADSIHAWKPGR
ncbi:MAG: beta-lactamase family protein [Haliscomenobacter sp.]|nr:beta-lactamase family protein [Haliscomenobacter sp.]